MVSDAKAKRIFNIYRNISISLEIHGADCELMHKERSHEEAGHSLPNHPDPINSFIELAINRYANCTALISIDTISISRIGRRSGPRG